MTEIEARVLYSIAHDEDFFPLGVSERLPELGIQCYFSKERLTLEELEKYTAVILNDPKDMHEDEVKSILSFKNERYGGVFLNINLLNESQADRFYRSPVHTLVKSLFNVEVVTKRVLPKVTLGEYEFTFKSKRGIFREEKTIRKKRKVEVNGGELNRFIFYVPQPHLPWVPQPTYRYTEHGYKIIEEKWEINESDVDFITSFVECNEGKDKTLEERTFLARGWLNYTDAFLSLHGYEEVGGVRFIMTDDGITALNRIAFDIASRYRNVGAISPLSESGRAIGICALKKILEVVGEERFNVLGFLSGGFKWISEPRKQKLGVTIYEKIEKPIEQPQKIEQPQVDLATLMRELQSIRAPFIPKEIFHIYQHYSELLTNIKNKNSLPTFQTTLSLLKDDFSSSEFIKLTTLADSLSDVLPSYQIEIPSDLPNDERETKKREQENKKEEFIRLTDRFADQIDTEMKVYISKIIKREDLRSATQSR
jgi:hypothetical protein